MRMRWPWLPPTPGEVGAILFGIVVVAAFVVLVVRYPGWQWIAAHSGFGPQWDCSPQGYGEPVCIKRVGSGAATERSR